MKKIIFTISIIFLIKLQIKAQWSNTGNNYTTGNLGIGTTSSASKLEVSGIGSNVDILRLSGNDHLTEDISLIFHPRKPYLTNPTASIKSHLDYGIDNNESGSLSFSTTQNGQLSEKMKIRHDGNVGIGTNNPDSRLTVAGNIHSREVKVTVDAGADFVLDGSYQIRTLEETEKFIIENKHLPEIASENEMLENGIQVG